MTAEESVDAVVTLLQGATVSVTDRAGLIDPETWQGLYHRDVRLLSRLDVTLAGRRPPLLAARREGAGSATQVHAAAIDDSGTPTALLLRRRTVGSTVRDSFEVRVFEGRLRDSELVVALGCDFAALQAVAHTLGERHPRPLAVTQDAALHAAHGRFGVTVSATGDGLRLRDDRVAWCVDAEPGRPWRAVVEFCPVYDGGEPSPPPARPAAALRVESRATRWQASVTSALADLLALRVHAPDLGLSYIAAGAPWYMALFGRDTLVAAFESLATGPDVALDVLRSLARRQGARHDDVTLEQPGRILHELRSGGTQVFGVEAGEAYYGSVDASPLFVMLLAEAHRWGAADDDVRGLLPNARAALRWCVAHGDVDGDGYVESVSDPNGLAHQGWKDSPDAMVHADGTPAPAPLALAEVQAYLYGAYLALSQLEERVGDAAAAAGLRRRAGDLKAAFHRDFWLPEQGLVAMGLDAEKRPLAVASSNIGHCLWTGLLDGEAAEAVARRLVAPDLATRWGVRTLAATEAAYNPLGYHLGSVWPHDSAIAVAGLARHGDRAAVTRLSTGLLEACEAFGWRLPELYAGLDAPDVPFPVPYPVACSPQAWSAAAPLLLLRAVLGLEPDVPAGVVRVAPMLPPDVQLTVTGIGLGAGSLDLRVHGSDVEVLAAPAALSVETA